MDAATKPYSALVGADDLETGEARNGLIQAASLTLTKSADGLIDPKLVLAWLLNALGAPAYLIGLLVPIREAGALLPQLPLAHLVATADKRKRVWAIGSVLQGLSALGIAAAALLLEGLAAGIAIVGLLAILSLSRALCSLSHKDTLARSLPKTRRGTVTGFAGSVAAGSVLLFGALLATGLMPLSVTSISLAIGLAGILWLAASAIFLNLREKGDGSDEADDPGLKALIEPLYEDSQLRLFIVTRALLTATALAPPFLVLLSQTDGGKELGQLGPLVLASSAATIVSSYVWGRLSDHSSRLTLACAGAVAAIVLGASAAMGLITGGLAGIAGAVIAIFSAQIAYEGVRAGRKLHLTDMTTDDKRARYTALSNSLIGLVLLIGSGLGVVADLVGIPATLAVLALMCAAASVLALGLDEVEQPAKG